MSGNGGWRPLPDSVGEHAEEFRSRLEKMRRTAQGDDEDLIRVAATDLADYMKSNGLHKIFPALHKALRACDYREIFTNIARAIGRY